MPQLALTLLGTLRVLVDGAERTVAGRKQRALIAALAVRGAPRSRESLVAELWPDASEERGRQSLRHALYAIGAEVAPDLVVSVGDALRIGDGVAVDVRELERAVASGTTDDLRRAVALYAGDLCIEVEGTDGESERARLRGLFAGAGEALAAGLLATAPREAAAVARRVIEVDPYREEAHRLLLRALGGAGDVAAAAAHYRRLAALLKHELGVEPSAETKQVYASLGRTASAASTVRVRRPSLEPPAELVGRRAEYGALMRVVSAAIDGRGGAALVVGEAGAGKSRLLEEIGAVSERHGLRVLRARASAAEGALPFQLWIDALAACAPDVVALPAPWPAVLATLLPDAAGGGAGEVAPELRRTRLFDAVARLLAHVARAAPTALVLDDLHYADADSVQLFHYVARGSRERRLAIIAAARPAPAGSALADARASLEARDALVTVPLEALAPDAVAELVARFGIDAATTSWLAPRVASWAGGNAFFTLEVLRALADQGRLRRAGAGWSWSGAPPGPGEALAADLPANVRDAILARLGALPDGTRRLLDLLAVVGAPARVELLASVAARDELSVADDLVPALEAGLLRDAPGGVLAFAHDLVADATYQRIPRAVRAAVHRRVAETLERTGATSRAIAFHLTAGGDAARAVARWLASAREAETRYAHDEAIRAYRAALDALGPSSPRRAEVLAAIGDAYLRRGLPAEGVAAFEAALVLLAPDAGDERAALAMRIASAARYYHRHADAREHAESAVAHYRAHGDGARLAAALVALAWVRYVDGDADAAHAAAQEARALGASLGDAHLEVVALRVAIWARWRAGDPLTGIERADAERLADEVGDDDEVAGLLVASATALTRRARLDDALALARRAFEIARRVGSLRVLLEAGEQVATLLRLRGAYREAVAIADETRAETSELELDEPPRLLGELVHLLALAGDDARTTALADELIAARAARGASPLHNSPALEAATALLTLGRPVDPAVIERERPTCATCQIHWLTAAGRHLAMGGDPARALALADELEEHTRDARYPLLAAVPAAIRARAYARAGRADESALAADEARAGFRATGAVQFADALERDLARLSAVHA